MLAPFFFLSSMGSAELSADLSRRYQSRALHFDGFSFSSTLLFISSFKVASLIFSELL